MQADPQEYRQLDLKVHSFLSDVQLHDVWIAELPGGGPGRTILDARTCFTAQTASTANFAVQLLFLLRRTLGWMMWWDREDESWASEYYSQRLTEEERAESLVPPGTEDTIFTVVYVHPYEALSEIRNATVHAFSCLALRPTMDGYRLYWAIYVKPISAWTNLYMTTIDPFRRAIVYPAVIDRIQMEWRTRFSDNA